MKNQINQPLKLRFDKVSTLDSSIDGYVYLSIEKMKTDQYQVVFDWLANEIGIDWILGQFDEDIVQNYFIEKCNREGAL